jgi:lactobin A/cerein 7B family class IIb bacteriocin
MENFKEMTAGELQEINGGFWALLILGIILVVDGIVRYKEARN